MIFYPQGKEKKIYIIPNRVEKIGDAAFSDDRRLEKLKILYNKNSYGQSECE